MSSSYIVIGYTTFNQNTTPPLTYTVLLFISWSNDPVKHTATLPNPQKICGTCPKGYVGLSTASSCSTCSVGKFDSRSTEQQTKVGGTPATCLVKGTGTDQVGTNARCKEVTDALTEFTLKLVATGTTSKWYQNIMIAPVGTTVTQGTSTGTLKQAIGKPIYAGYTSGIVIHTKEGVVFTAAADVVVGADTIPAANIQTATGATEPPTATTCLPFRESTCISTSGTNLNCANLVNPTQATCAAASADISGTCFANDCVFKLNGDSKKENFRSIFWIKRNEISLFICCLFV